MKPILSRMLAAMVMAGAFSACAIPAGKALAPQLDRAQTSRAFDGPYAAFASGGWLTQWLESADKDEMILHVRTRRLAVGEPLVVSAVGDLPGFAVKARDRAEVAPDTIRTRSNAPLFVMADTHGEFEIAVALLRQQGVIDQALGWSFGDGHLVVLGDILDRGSHQTEILWLLYELEAQAAAAGGGLHLVLGNHESMVMQGDLRYLNPKYLKTAQALGATAYSDLLGPDTVLGQWLRSKATVLKINDLLFLHGGISEELVERGLDLAQINQGVRDRLGGTVPETPTVTDRDEFLFKKFGPLWYRGYFEAKDIPRATPAAVDRILGHFDTRAMFVGHTKVPTVTPLYDGKVIAVQVYPHRDERSGKPVMEGLLIRDGAFFKAHIDGRLEVLGG